MKSFLGYVAEDLLKTYGRNLSRVAVVFPNKRAALFLNEELGQLCAEPLWSPAYMTISELFRKHSKREVADPIKLVCDLYRCFTEQTGFEETLDHFYGWGQVLLADFDDVDKNMADAKQVFKNLRDLHELDDVSYLNDEQKEIIRKFFSNFSDEHETELKRRFLQLWTKMGDIYQAFNERLTTQGLAYEGALYREVAEQEDITFEYEQYVFVGFNLLQQVEQRLFRQLKKQGKARFYWDFDHYYMPKDGTKVPHEAGFFIAQYLKDFPNALDTRDEEIYGNFEKEKRIRFVAATTENAQARFLSRETRDERREARAESRETRAERREPRDERREAIVMCNEGLLQTVVHALPETMTEVNITTGFPLIQTPAASLVGMLMELQTTGYSRQKGRYRLTQVNKVLCHPYIKYLTEEVDGLYKELNDKHLNYPTPEMLAINEEMKLLFTPCEGVRGLLAWLCEIVRLTARRGTEVENEKEASAERKENGTGPLMQESMFRMYTLLNRLLGLMDSGDLTVELSTLQRLIGQLVAGGSVPFHGEPIERIQVMGVLETRNLDFDKVVLLSCNEGNMPKGVNDTSFIPYSLRKAYGLTTIDHKVAIYSYYFHRLLQRARDVIILYNNATNDGQRSEMSRFMLQLLVESNHHIELQTLQTAQQYTPFNPVTIEKDAEMMEKLRERFDLSRHPEQAAVGTRVLTAAEAENMSPLLTPTAINRYMRCPLVFYYTYVCGIRQPNEVEDDVIDNRAFGNIFHHASETLYRKLTALGGEIKGGDIDRMLKEKVDIERAVDDAIEKELRYPRENGAAMSDSLNGLQLINREVIIHYLRRLLELDRQLAPFKILGIEMNTIAKLETKFITTTIGGRIDRLDKVESRESGIERGETIRVVDYKTGGKKLTVLDDVESIFAQESLSKHSDYYLQTFLYGCIVRTSKIINPEGLPVSPALLFIQHAGGDDYDPVLQFKDGKIADVETDRKTFGTLLKATVDEMFDPEKPFVPTADRQRCTNCIYQLLCKLAMVLVLFGGSIMGAWGKHQVLSPQIKSLQVVVNDRWTQLPIMELGSDDVVRIGFDELSHEFHRYIAHLEHCEADWSPSEEIFENDWLEGFNDIPLDDYEKSLNTTVLYTHYKIQFPNDQCRLKMSGNYRLHILDEDNDNEEVLVAEFRVVESRMDIGLGVTVNTDLGLNGRYQQVEMSLNYNGLPVTFPEEQLRIFVMQNSREDNQKVDVAPNYVTPKGLRWEHNRGLIFDAGDEYHKYEVLDPTHITMGLERVWWDEEEGRYHVQPWVCEPQRNYLYDEDANGAFYIRNSDNYENDRLSDYVWVHYKLQNVREYDSEVIIDGQWTTEAPENYVMSYNEQDRSYNGMVLQKMGYYNYQLLLRDADGTTHRVPEEGSFYQTENRYQVLVYYKGNGERTWRLVGTRGEN